MEANKESRTLTEGEFRVFPFLFGVISFDGGHGYYYILVQVWRVLSEDCRTGRAAAVGCRGRARHFWKGGKEICHS